jgi:hypothetical protein
MDATLQTQIEELARETASVFVDEFGEALDSEKTDWDEKAWQEDARTLNLTEEHKQEGWPVYQAALVTETQRLCGAA